MRWWRWVCCWSAGRSRPPSASVPAGRWRPASELQGAGTQKKSSVTDGRRWRSRASLNLGAFVFQTSPPELGLSPAHTNEDIYLNKLCPVFLVRTQTHISSHWTRDSGPSADSHKLCFLCQGQGQQQQLKPVDRRTSSPSMLTEFFFGMWRIADVDSIATCWPGMPV